MLRRVLRRFSSFEYDLAVVGAGPGGYVAAIKAAQLGMKTVCVEGRATLGGTCLNVGCIPSKSLLNSSHKWHDLQHEMATHGILADNPRIDFGQMMKMKQKAVVGLTKGIEQLFKKNKVERVVGWGGLQDDHTISVREQDKIARTLSAKNIILATGSIPSPMPGGALTFDRKRILSSTGALELPEIPKKLVVVGGGVIGLELGSVYCRLGSDVTVVEFLDRITPTADIETSKAFQTILKKQGIKFQLGTKVVAGENKGDHVELQVESKGEKSTLEADYVLVAVGRSPNTQDLNLDQMGISYDKRGFIDVNDDLQIPNKENIYAIGDCIRGPMLAHKAEEEGIFAAEHIAGTMCHMNYDAIPGVVYTYPELAYVGQTEEQLKEAGIKYNKGSFPFMANSRARANHDADGFVKILSDKETDKILGAHIISANAGEMIMEAVIGIEYGASSEDIGRTCHAHPSLSEAFKEACLATYSKPIHFQAQAIKKMRPTNLGFRSPKERTPEFYNSSFTRNGDDTKWERRTFRKTVSSWGNEKRFIGYDQLFKRYSMMVGPGSYSNDQSSIQKSKIKGGRCYTGYHGDRPVWNNAYYFTGDHLVYDGTLVPISGRRNSYDEECPVDTSPQTNRTKTPGQSSYRSRSADPRNKEESSQDAAQARIQVRSIRKRLFASSPNESKRTQSARTTKSGIEKAYDRPITMKRKRNGKIKKLLNRRLRKS